MGMFGSHFHKTFAFVDTCGTVSKPTSREDYLAAGDIYLAVKACPAFHDVLFSKRERRGGSQVLFGLFALEQKAQSKSTNQPPQ